MKTIRSLLPLSTPAGDLPPYTARSRNLVRFARHLPIETMDESFAADYGFKDHGSRFALLKSPKTDPGPDECYGIYARDARLLFRKLLGLRIEYEGLGSQRAAQLSFYNSMNYYRSHVEEHFYHNGTNPVPPLEGECVFWFAAPDILVIRYRFWNKVNSEIPLRLCWYSEGEPGRGYGTELRSGGIEFWNEAMVGKVAYTARAELRTGDAGITFRAEGPVLKTREILRRVPPGGKDEVRFGVRFAFNDEPLPPWSEDLWSEGSLAGAIAENEQAFRRFRRLPRLSSLNQDLALKAIGVLRALRYWERRLPGDPLMTIHAGKTGVCATWFWDTGCTLPALGLINEHDTIRGALRVLTRGIRPDGTPPVTCENGVYQYSYQMPLLTWGAGHCFAASPDPGLMEEIYEPLSRYVRHWLERFRTPHGVVIHPPGMSCLDDAKRWQRRETLVPAPGQPWTEVQGDRMHSSEYAPPDVNTFLALEMRTLAVMAEAMGYAKDAAHWKREGERLAEAINHWLFEPETGTYQDRHVETGVFGGMVHMGSFLPLYAGFAPAEIGRAMCRNYLLAPNHFLTPMPFPVVDRAHPSYRPGGYLFAPPEFPGSLVQHAYWCGRTWIHSAVWMLGALWRYGFQREAGKLADRILLAASRSESLVECYDSLTGFGNGHPEFMWSAAAVLLLLDRFYERSAVPVIRP